MFVPVVECTANEDCQENQVCVKNKCVDACKGQCGSNALCCATDHKHNCYCRPGYIGDPMMRCSQGIHNSSLLVIHLCLRK